jgi:hypothetical protein
MSIGTQEDKIKAFNKKLANGKADSMIRIDEIGLSTRNWITAIEQNVPELVKEEFIKFSPRKEDSNTG